VGASTTWEALPGLRRSKGAFWEEPWPLESLVEVLCCWCCCLAGGRLDEEERPPAGCLSPEASRAVEVEDGLWSKVSSSRIKAERTSGNVGSSRDRRRWRPTPSKRSARPRMTLRTNVRSKTGSPRSLRTSAM
jgi:hypothetical protein